jgi:hypothetical protein
MTVAMAMAMTTRSERARQKRQQRDIFLSSETGRLTGFETIRTDEIDRPEVSVHT